MLDNKMAQRLIDKAAKFMNYNINIMDKQGIIIASRDISRIGTFHEAAFQILHQKKNIEVVDQNSNFLGAKPGINLAIKYKDENLGVIGVSGDPKEVMNVAYIVKMFMETMLEYELYKEEIWQLQNKRDLMLNMLLYSYDIDLEEIVSMAKKLEFKTDLSRIPIIIKCLSEQDPKKILEIVRGNPHHSKQDLFTITRDDNIIVFKSLNGDKAKLLKGYKEEVVEYIESFLKACTSMPSESFIFYIGTIQSNFSQYKESYRHATWLNSVMKENGNIHFFNDYVSDYIKSIVPVKVYRDIFNMYEHLFLEDEFNKADFIVTVEALHWNNYNLVKSAKKLFIHRNTMIFRLNKIKEMFHVDPVNHYNDRQLLYYLAHFLKEKGGTLHGLGI